MLPFEGRKFDIQIFLNSPLCIGKWTSENGAGCLLTAFWRGLGYTIDQTTSCGRIEDLREETDKAFEIFNIEMPKMALEYKYLSSSPVCHILKCFDGEYPLLAFDLLWQLIDKLPKVESIKLEDKEKAEKQVKDLCMVK